MYGNNIKRHLYTAGLSATAFTLPLSEWMLSVFIIILFAIWIATGGIEKIRQLINEQRSILIFFITYLVYVVWMIRTSDIRFGLTELRLKLPLIVFPLVTGLSKPLGRHELKIVLSVFIAGVVVSSVTGILINIEKVVSGYAESNQLSPFISHIRLAIMAVFAIACSAWLFFSSPVKSNLNILYAVASVWLSVFIFLLLSFTGMVLLIVTFCIAAIVLALRTGSIILKISVPAVITLLFIFAAVLVNKEIRLFYKPGNPYSFPLSEKTTGGNLYRHYPDRKDIENGNRVWIFICEEEMRKEWNRRSQLPYDSLDEKGQGLSYTLIRYLSSAGLTKDSAGIAVLSAADVQNVEKGQTNRLFSEWNPWKTRIYETIWQIDYYRNGGNPSGHSFTQRIEFFKTGWRIFRINPLFGTGTGDIYTEFEKQYEADNSKLDKEHRLLAHNQFLTFLVSFGLTGLIMICISMLYPVIKSKALTHLISALFLVMIFLSMLWEDTLETHTGVSFFAYFYSVFIFGFDNYEKEDNL